MKMKSIFLSLLIVSVLLLSALAFSLPAVRAQSKGSDWALPFADIGGTNYSPQTVINKQNVGQLEVKWIFPLNEPALPGYIKIYGVVYPPFTGITTPPVIVNGIVYFQTADQNVYAMNAASGKVIWKFTPKVPGLNFVNTHTHTITTYNGLLWVQNPFDGYGQLAGLDLLTGDVKVNITGLWKNIPGQRYGGNSSGLYAAEWAPVFYKNIAVVQTATVDFIVRGFAAGYDITTGKMVWRWYTVPPAPNCDPNWDSYQEVEYGNGTIVHYPNPKGNIKPYLGDWGTRCDLNGAAGPWNNAGVDPDTGTVYIGTSGAYPVGNSQFRPGPNLYGGTIVALDALTGKMKWFYQTTTHDVTGEQDCNWSEMFINTGTRKLVLSPCRSYFYALDATTGDLVYSYDPMTNEATGTKPHAYPWGANQGNNMNMTYNPAAYKYLGGINEMAPAFDGKNVYYWGQKSIWCQKGLLPGDKIPAPPELAFLNKPGCPDGSITKVPYNGTLVAMDANTGNVRWSKTFSGTGLRGAVTVTGGLMWVGLGDGNLYALDTDTGNIVYTRFMGVGLNYAPTFAADSNGNMKMFVTLGGGAFWGNVPGNLVAFGLPPNLPVTTTTRIATTTQIATTTERSTVVSTVQGPSTGIDPGTFYGVTGLAVVFIIVTGILVVRRRMPTS